MASLLAETKRQSGSALGVLWLTASGAVLILAAAALFVAVNWSRIPDETKFAGAVALTIAIGVGGALSRTAVPLTARVATHLAALLVGVDALAVARNGQLSGSATLLTVAVALTASTSLLLWLERTAVARWVLVASVAGAAVGLDGVAAVPVATSLGVLAGASLIARLAGRVSVALAVVAPLSIGVAGRSVLGLTFMAGEFWHVVGVAIAVFVLADLALRHRDVELAIAAVAVTAPLAAVLLFDGVGFVASGLLAGASLFLLVELAALLGRRDPLWAPVTRFTAAIVEVAAGLGVVVFLAFGDELPLATAGLVAVVAWLVSDLRHHSVLTPAAVADEEGNTFAVAAAGLAGVGPLLLVFSPADAVALAAGATAALLAPTRRHWAAVVAPVLGVVAVLASFGHEAVGVAVALVLARSVGVVRSGTGRVDEVRLADGLGLALLPALALASLDGLTPGPFLVAVGALWIVGVVVAPADDELTDFAHLVGLLAVSSAFLMSPGGGVIAASGVSLLVVVEAIRRREALIAVGLGLSVPIVAVLGFETIEVTAIVAVWLLTVAGLVLGLAGAALQTWPQRLPRLARPFSPMLNALGAGFIVGAGISGDGQASSLAVVLLAAGALIYVYGKVARIRGLCWGGLATAYAGWWVLLTDLEVHFSEPYVLPLAAAFLLLRADGAASSWADVGPGAMVMVGSPLYERLVGGPGWHAVVAGAIGVAAVLWGVIGRLGAPLIVGTTALVALVALESLAYTPSVPTWAWLGLAGSVLAGSGIVMERAGVGPLESGRLLVDRFERTFR